MPLRPATPDDVPLILPLIDALLSHHGVSGILSLDDWIEHDDNVSSERACTMERRA